MAVMTCLKLPAAANHPTAANPSHHFHLNASGPVANKEVEIIVVNPVQNWLITQDYLFTVKRDKERLFEN